MSRLHNGLAVWFTGLSGAGKSTICDGVEQALRDQGYRVEVLDGDVVREGLTKDLGFSKADRDTNIRRIGFVTKLLARNEVIVLVPVISPYRAMRDEMRAQIDSFVEVYVSTPLAVCEARDVKGLYKKARAGELKQFTGIDDPYEPPLNPELECKTEQTGLEACVEQVIALIESRTAVA